MASPTAALSRTLQTITLTKINELEKQRKSYASSKNAVLNSASNTKLDQRERILCLLNGVQELHPVKASSDTELPNIRRWLEQSHFDASIPDEMLDDFEAKLRSKLDVQTRRLDLAALYSRLLTEWLNPKNLIQERVPEDTGSLDGSFEVVEKDRLKQLKDKFENVVFTPLKTDEDDISEYLGSLFTGDVGKKALEQLQGSTAHKSSHILLNKNPFDERSIRWCLKGLLANDLLRDDKKVILQEFLQDQVARAEICDVLNMKFVDIKNWQWDAGPEGLPVEPRSQLNGKYRIMMDEDVLDAIFLHYIGMMWSVEMKTILCRLVRDSGIWKNNVNIPQDVKDRRKYFLGDNRSSAEGSGSVEKVRQDMYRDDFFLSQLPSTVYEGAGGYEDEAGDVDSDSESDKKSPKEVKQQLLRLMATEVHIQKTLNGECAVVQSDFQWFGTAIPHSSIFAVLRFAGVDEKWIDFFKKFLEAPLNMSPVSEGEEGAGQVRIRKRGVPMAHSLEKFFGELTLFFMDLAVNREAEMLLYRFHDDLWLVGEPQKCAKAWQTMERYSAVMGLEFNKSKTGSVFLTKNKDLTHEDSEVAVKLPSGSVSMGFLHLDPSSGEWVINQKEVGAHVKQLSKQLANSTSILAWVQTWNSCIGRFFSHTFGEPANCFGRGHVDAIVSTYKRMQDAIFPDSNVSSFLKDMIEERFGITDVPDAFIFLPESLGGLGVRNPFISPFLVRGNVCLSTSARMAEFLEEEEEAYHLLKRQFDELGPQGRKRQLRIIYTDEYGDSNPSITLEDPDTFMTRKEFTLNRESTSQELLEAYEYLMEVPRQRVYLPTPKVSQTMRALAISQPELEAGSMKGEMTWILHTYEKELVEKCGGMSIVEKNLLPLGILTILRKRRVAWQMVL